VKCLAPFLKGILRSVSIVLCCFALLLLAGCTTVGFGGRGAGRFHTVILDPGHGGHDRGARPLYGKYEKDLALDVALRTAEILRHHGFRVILTRDHDVFISLPRRVSIAQRYRNSIFVSIHFNWTRRSAASGFETYYYSPQSRRLAANIQKEIHQANAGIDRGVKSARFYVLRNNPRPAVLVELGFVSNPRDNKLAQDPEHRNKLAQAIAAGILAERRGRAPSRR
jgi:N-acetylmuramoyl-L-alanine amidase